MERKSIAGLTDYALEMLGYNKEKILKAVENCVIAMGELTIEESKVARKHLDSVMEEMYKRSPDTLINTIQPRL
nr:MAG TPA_asm: RuvA, C-terminal domain [Caudoviricetes sp.]